MGFVEFSISFEGVQEKIAVREEDVEKFISCGEQETILKLYAYSRRGRSRKKKKTILVQEPFEKVLEKLNKSRYWQ